MNSYIDNKRHEGYSLKNRSVMERRDYKQNSVCCAIFYYLENKTNKQKAGNILMPLEAFTATKPFQHVFEQIGRAHV